MVRLVRCSNSFPPSKNKTPQERSSHRTRDRTSPPAGPAFLGFLLAFPPGAALYSNHVTDTFTGSSAIADIRRDGETTMFIKITLIRERIERVVKEIEPGGGGDGLQREGSGELYVSSGRR